MRHARSSFFLASRSCLLLFVWGCEATQEGEEEGSKLDKYCASADPADTETVVVEIPSGVNSRSVGAVLRLPTRDQCRELFDVCSDDWCR